MPRTPAKFTQMDVTRAVRAAQQCGAAGVEIKPDGTILVLLSPQTTIVPGQNEPQVEPKKKVVL